jgi:fatty acid desaturase
MNGALEETLRIAATLGVLGAVLLVWALILPNLTPFPVTFTPTQAEAERKRAERYRRLHETSLRVDILFFVWLVVEGAFLVPWMFGKYGMA